MLYLKPGAVLALVLLLACAPTAHATSSTVPPESWGRLLTPSDAPAQSLSLQDSATTTRSLNLQATGLIAFVNVHVDLVHPRPTDLELALVSPSGTRVVLARNVAGVSGTFGDRLSPAEPLEVLEGEEPWGAWQLEVTDQQSGAVGQLRSWGLDLQLQSKGTQTRHTIRTPYEKQIVRVGGLRRRIFYQVPLGTPPAAGWPVAFLFHGAGATSQTFWQGRSWFPYRAWYQAKTIKDLLDAGYVVLAPEAKHYGTIWETSLPSWANRYRSSADHALMEYLMGELVQGRYGFVDTTRYYAGGISSGGYMSSRMAITYPGRFRALAIHGGAYATNLGPLYGSLPPRMPAQHPPTLFLHGGLDFMVPIWTMRRYRDALQREGISVRTVVDPTAGHLWISQAPEEILNWFEQH